MCGMGGGRKSNSPTCSDVCVVKTTPMLSRFPWLDCQTRAALPERWEHTAIVSSRIITAQHSDHIRSACHCLNTEQISSPAALAEEI